MKYDNVSCSQCGRSFGPGDHGFSHCEDHPGYVQDMKYWQEQLLKIAVSIIEKADDMDYRLMIHGFWHKPYSIMSMNCVIS
jgi:hypothetical protein